MRLAVVMNFRSPWAREAVIRLASLGSDVHVLGFASPGRDPGYLDLNEELHREGVAGLSRDVASIRIIPSRSSSAMRYFTCLPEFRRVLKDVAPNMLLTLYGGGFGTMAFMSGFRPYAVYVVGSDVLLQRRRHRHLSRFALTSASMVLANGSYLADRTRELAPKARVFPLYLGVDTERFQRAFAPPTPVRIVCTRGFQHVYNNEQIVRALALLPDLACEFCTTFVSSGPLLPAARRLADDILPKHVRERTEFLDGATDAALLETVRKAHVYVSLSRSDGTSASLLEALACGVFPVVSDIPQNREWIDPAAGNGILVPLDDVPALAAALARAATHDKERAQAALHNRAMIERRANNRRNMGDLLTKLEEEVSRRASARNGSV